MADIRPARQGKAVRTTVYVRILTTVLVLFCCSAAVRAQDVLIYGTIKAIPDSLPIVDAAVLVSDERGVMIDGTTSVDSGYYEIGLALGREYHVRYEVHGSFPKTLVIDLRNVDVPPEELEGGWGMNINMTLLPRIEGVPDSLISLPFGRASWNAGDGNFQFDLDHTQRVRDAWAPWMEAAMAARIERPTEPWNIALSFVLLLGGLSAVWRLYMADRYKVILSDPDRARKNLMAALLLAAVLVAFAWSQRNGPGWVAWWAAMAAALAVAVLLFTFHAGFMFLDHLWPDDPLPSDHERQRATRIMGRMKFVCYMVVLIGALWLWMSLDRMLDPWGSLARIAIWAIGLFVLALVLLRSTVRRWFVLRSDRARFWSLALLLLLIGVPAVAHFTDQRMARPTSTRQVEITGLYESTGRRGRVKYTAHVFVNGNEKELRMGKEDWDAASDMDALDLRIGPGPCGIDHIISWQLVQRTQQVMDSTEAE